eukprot:TRINITY_DN71895_c0_g1_i1.p1 TRINITY_DN71895_c0_g1~~TRINITY_DN71895_c0_g1_i1.p1  ORF type:complete len:413 (+),score=118.10 TRINITY_DN71895_c0_g1_i1:77-1315(+)
MAASVTSRCSAPRTWTSSSSSSVASAWDPSGGSFPSEWSAPSQDEGAGSGRQGTPCEVYGGEQQERSPGHARRFVVPVPRTLLPGRAMDARCPLPQCPAAGEIPSIPVRLLCQECNCPWPVFCLTCVRDWLGLNYYHPRGRPVLRCEQCSMKTHLPVPPRARFIYTVDADAAAELDQCYGPVRCPRGCGAACWRVSMQEHFRVCSQRLGRGSCFLVQLYWKEGHDRFRLQVAQTYVRHSIQLQAELHRAAQRRGVNPSAITQRSRPVLPAAPLAEVPGTPTSEELLRLRRFLLHTTQERIRRKDRGENTWQEVERVPVLGADCAAVLKALKLHPDHKRIVGPGIRYIVASVSLLYISLDYHLIRVDGSVQNIMLDSFLPPREHPERRALGEWLTAQLAAHGASPLARRRPRR